MPIFYSFSEKLWDSDLLDLLKLTKLKIPSEITPFLEFSIFFYVPTIAFQVALCTSDKSHIRVQIYRGTYRPKWPFLCMPGCDTIAQNSWHPFLSLSMFLHEICYAYKNNQKIQTCRNYFCHEHILLDMRQKVVTIVIFFAIQNIFNLFQSIGIRMDYSLIGGKISNFGQILFFLLFEF